MATPIETNTEELQEILQTVYNLPMAGGGSSEPDLMIGLNIDNTKLCPDGSSAPCRSLTNMTKNDVSIISGSISEVAEKVKQGLPVKVMLNEVHFYWDNRWTRGIGEATHVQFGSLGSYPSEEGTMLVVTFFLSNTPIGTNYPCHMRIFIDVATESVGEYSCYNLNFAT